MSKPKNRWNGGEGRHLYSGEEAEYSDEGRAYNEVEGIWRRRERVAAEMASLWAIVAKSLPSMGAYDESEISTLTTQVDLLNTLLDSQDQFQRWLWVDLRAALNEELTKRRFEIQVSAVEEEERRRAERIAASQDSRVTVEVESPRCIICQKKPRSVDDYCKKCAREAGIVVRGKIGSGP